ncbi:hypothetical protein IFM89_032487 [Coptis chinensis]|uniref:RNA helicase n=1 Tax=Coptis chinensis TaxID=261450 RepID=A0A835IVZ9_9MAGN|nr:hypothetical protein IFM89_032487 [Coptis chinensis]
MGTGWGSGSDDECSVIGDKGEIGFIDYQIDKSVCNYNPSEEGPVIISVPFPFASEKPQSVLVGETASDSVTINNTTSEPIDLWAVKIFCSNPEDSYTLSLMKPPSANSNIEDVDGFLETFALEDRVLQPYKTLTIWLSCKPKETGLHTTVVHFTVGEDTIERVVFLLVEDSISLSLASRKPYSRPQRKNRFAVTEYVSGTRPARPGSQGFRYRLPQFNIPPETRELLESKQLPEVISDGLTRESYGAFFSTLITMEELKLEEEMHRHDMECVTMRMRRYFLALEVPGLAEKRPSLVIGDFVFTKHANGGPTDNTPAYQMTSVEMILGCKGAPPYVIHGPPGTGKTLTLVEAMLQLYKTRNNTRILVCASSNSAADHILEKLINKEFVKVEESKIFRLNATSRPYEDVHPENIRFCYFQDYVFRCPPIKALMRYRIVISTYMSASLLYAEGIKQGHFSHIFLDEAGQASEPETMVPISNLCRRETVVVLAGDPMQLGPVIYSKDAETYGLGKSYLERLFECEFYHNEDENYVTKLVRNYRCHPAILELPSKLFYKGELIADKEEGDSSIDAYEDILPNKKFPVLFIGIQGCDEREGNNPSWFNRIEASKVVEIIRKLRASADLNDSDIGVITPYRQQVLKLKKILEDQLDMPDVKVGSVEQFQGQERQVIIISTVRSTVRHNEFDRVHYLGFLSNPRRFNVAITRARSLVVIIGNPHIITKDPYWDKLLRYCADNNSYQGCPLPERQEEIPEEDFPSSQKLYHEQDNFQQSKEFELSSKSLNIAENPKGVRDVTEWSDDCRSTETPVPQHNQAIWSDSWKPTEAPMPVADWDEHSDGWNSREISKPECDWAKRSDDWKSPDIPMPVTNEAESDPWMSGEIPEPEYDQDKWSDGWK